MGNKSKQRKTKGKWDRVKNIAGAHQLSARLRPWWFGLKQKSIAPMASKAIGSGDHPKRQTHYRLPLQSIDDHFRNAAQRRLLEVI